MKSRTFFLFLGWAIFTGAVGISCSAIPPKDIPEISTIVSTTEVSAMPSIVPSTTPLPTLMFSYPTSTIPLPTPYATASVVRTNAVAFIDDSSLWVANVDGSGERKLVDIERNTEWVSQYLLQWSPDGKWIGYISGDDLWIISPDGFVKRKLLSIQDNSKKIVRQYTWSPDSSKIAYALAANWADFPEIRTGLLDLSTEKDTELSSYQSSASVVLAWSPNGEYLLLNTTRSLTVFDITAGNGLREIKLNENCPLWHGGLIWSPNSKWLYHLVYATGTYGLQICLSGLDGSSWQIADVGSIVSPPVWDKTGKFLYFVVGEQNLNIGPNLFIDQKLVRYDVAARKIETLLPLAEHGATGRLWSLSLSPNGRTLALYAYTYYEDRSRPGHIYVDTARPKQNKFIILDLTSFSTAQFNLEFEGEIKEQLPPPMWSYDNQNIIFFLSALVRQSFGISFSDYGSFYSLDIKTGKVAIFSGVHAVKNALISPIATPHVNNN